jgi:hypothetical protein
MTGLDDLRETTDTWLITYGLAMCSLGVGLGLQAAGQRILAAELGPFATELPAWVDTIKYWSFAAYAATAICIAVLLWLDYKDRD